MLTQNTLSQNLHKSVLFGNVGAEEVAQIIAVSHWLVVKQGDYVYRQGENDRRFYMVADGEVELTLIDEGGGQIIVSHIGQGGHFGETALLTNSRNSLNARALANLSLIWFDSDTFSSVLLANNFIQHQLSITLANRLRISFHDHANALAKAKNIHKSSDHSLDPTFFLGSQPSVAENKQSLAADSETRLAESTIARQSRKAARLYSENLKPVLLTGEAGTGRRMVAYEVHRASAYKNGPYLELDILIIDPAHLEAELFGFGGDSFAFSQIDQLGILERLKGGTVVLYNAEYLEPDFQRQLEGMIRKYDFTRSAQHPRIILICKDRPRQQDSHNRLLPSLYTLVAGQHFTVAPLREHRRDIPRLIQYYLKRYSLQYNKVINLVDDRTLGTFMNYDWPGNLTEMASVVQRAVILGKSNEPLNHQILLGIPKPEGKWEFNLLRLPGIRAFFSSRLFPVLPRVVVTIFFVLVLIALFFGPATAEKNIGLTLSWVVGWPLLIFSFFFLARTWCSICALSVPGWLAQLVLKPQRPTPRFIKQYSGWILTCLCIFLFWIEIAWNAYESPRLTAWIISSITLGALFFSMFFKRRVWCRYLCPLGAINALFAMPSILELRANTHMCVNRCTDHLCYTGDDSVAGCPMFRHPSLVDNNRDCILCGQCIKNCQLNSIHLNLRLAPQELWNQQSPRLEDSVLVVSLAAIFYPFAISQKYPGFVLAWTDTLHHIGLPYSPALTSSIFLFICILIYLVGYAIMSKIMARTTGNNWRATSSILGYGMIPLVLGAFMAVHLEIFIGGIWLLSSNLQDVVGIPGNYNSSRLMGHDAASILKLITIIGGLIASLYATQRIVKRLLGARQYSQRVFVLPALLLCLSAMAYLLLA